jgi:hypothetical protein
MQQLNENRARPGIGKVLGLAAAALLFAVALLQPTWPKLHTEVVAADFTAAAVDSMAADFTVAGSAVAGSTVAGSTVAGSTVGSQGMAATGAVDVMAGVAGSGWD